MVEISVSEGNAVFVVQGMDKLWALKSELSVPLAHIAGARVDTEAARGWWHGIRMPGTEIPGLITAGSFYSHGRRMFYDVHDPDNTIVVELAHESYDCLIVEVADPESDVRRINLAIAAATH